MFEHPSQRRCACVSFVVVLVFASLLSEFPLFLTRRNDGSSTSNFGVQSAARSPAAAPDLTFGDPVEKAWPRPLRVPLVVPMWKSLNPANLVFDQQWFHM